MAILQFGYVIQKRREKLGLSQEELADGICSVTTLSRLENGTRMPTKNHFEMILQRLGYSDMFLDNYVSKKEFDLHELKFDIRQSYINHEFDKGRKLLVDFENLIEDPSPIDEQFMLLYDVLLNIDKYTNKEMFNVFEKAIKYTYPKYDMHMKFYALSYEEILILNNIAVCYAIDGKVKKAIDIFYNMKEFYDARVINIEEALRTKLLVLANLAEALELSGRYDECIEISDLVISACKNTARCRWLSKVLRLKAAALSKKNKGQNIDIIVKCVKEAFYMASILDNDEEMKLINEFMCNNYKELNFRLVDLL